MASKTGGLKANFEIINAPASMPPGERDHVDLRIENNGTVEWNASALEDNPFFFDVAYHIMNSNGGIVLYDGLRSFLPKNVKPGETIQMQLEILAPVEPGTYRFNIDIVREHVTWFGSVGSPTAEVFIEVT